MRNRTLPVAEGRDALLYIEQEIRGGGEPNIPT